MGRGGIDDHDRTILRRLREDARIPVSQIAKDLGLSITACRVRLKNLEERGYIERYTVLLKSQNTRFQDFRYILIGLSNKSSPKVEEMCGFLRSMNNLVMLELIEGKYDLLTEFGFASGEEFRQLHRKISDHPLCELIESVARIRAVREFRIEIDQLI